MAKKPSAIGILSVVLLVVAGCAPAAPPSPTAAPAKAVPTTAPTVAAAARPATTAAAAPAPKAAATQDAAGAGFQTLLEAAKKETGLVVWVTTPNLEPTQKAVFEAFKQRFGLSQLKGEWVPLAARDAVARVQAEAQAGRYSVDVLESGLSNMRPLVEAGLVAKVDWVGLFGKELPGVREAGERIVADYAGLGLAHWDVAYVIAHNTDQVKPEDVPDKLEDFTDPKWMGRFALNASGATPFDIMTLEWGKDKTLDVVKRMIANRPLYKNGTPAVIVAVGQGEAAFGIGQVTGTHTEKLKGAPIAWKPMSSIPVLPQFFYVPKTTPNPNVARLFIAWAATEGMKIQEEMENIGRVTDPNSFILKEIKRMAPNAKLVYERTLADTAILQDVAEQIIKLRTGT